MSDKQLTQMDKMVEIMEKGLDYKVKYHELERENAKLEFKIKKMDDEITELKQALEMENEARHQEHIEQQIEEYVATPPHWSDKY